MTISNILLYFYCCCMTKPSISLDSAEYRMKNVFVLERERKKGNDQFFIDNLKTVFSFDIFFDNVDESTLHHRRLVFDQAI